MRVLITGVTGFAGGHLAESLVGAAELHGTSRASVWPNQLRHLAPNVTLHSCQLTQPHAIEAVLRRVQPDQIYHLAGYARVKESFRDEDRVWADNLTATHSLYRAVERWGGKPKILYVSSGLVYDHAGACDADTRLLPASPYAASKAAADLLSYQVSRHPGLNIVRVRPFNQIGPRQRPDFAVARFACELARIESGLIPPLLETGDLNAHADLTDIRDMVMAYRAVMRYGVPGEVYVAGTGVATSMQDIVSRLTALVDRPIEIRRRLDLHRPADSTVSLANPAHLTALTGWKPIRSLEKTLADVLNYWRHEFESERQRKIAV